jgi:hypothetical protein
MFNVPKKLSATLPTVGFSHTAFYGVDLECGAVVITSKLDSAAIIVKKDDMASEFGLEREGDFPHERTFSLNTSQAA